MNVERSSVRREKGEGEGETEKEEAFAHEEDWRATSPRRMADFLPNDTLRDERRALWRMRLDAPTNVALRDERSTSNALGQLTSSPARNGRPSRDGAPGRGGRRISVRRHPCPLNG